MQLALFGTVKTPLDKEIPQGCRAAVRAEEGCISTCCDIHCLLRDGHHDPAAVACGQQMWGGEISWAALGAGQESLPHCGIGELLLLQDGPAPLPLSTSPWGLCGNSRDDKLGLGKSWQADKSPRIFVPLQQTIFLKSRVPKHVFVLIG